MENKSRGFNSRWGFILASVGSAVGMANVWGFPNKLGSNGGGAFLIIYLFFIFIFSYVGLPAEFAIGRLSKTGTLGSYEKAWSSRSNKLKKVGIFVGWLPLIGAMCIAIGYAIIISYTLKALTNSITGELMTSDAGTWFESFAFSDFSVIPYHIIIIVVTLLTLILGAKSIEKTNKIMMPTFFVIFLILAVRILFLPNTLEGYLFIITPTWSSLLDPMVWIWAMGQAFFSLSLTGGSLMVYGSYLEDDENIMGTSRNVAFFDTIAAIIATLVIIPACFSYSLDLNSGPSLLFITLPTILQDIPFGKFFAIILYIAMVFAGISSLQNMFEAVTESLLFKFPKLNRKVTLIILSIICISFGLFMEPIYKWGPWMDFVSIYIIPIGATLGSISWFWVMKKEHLIDEINKGSTKKQGNLWYFIGKYIYVPFTIILSLVALFMNVAF